MSISPTPASTQGSSLKSSPTGSSTSGYGSNGETGCVLEGESTKIDVTLDVEGVAFPTWPDGVENITGTLAADILHRVAQAQPFPTLSPDVQVTTLNKLGDFQSAISRVVYQDGDYCRRLSICEMQAELRNVKLIRHRLKTKNIMLTSRLDLSVFFYTIGQALYDIAFLRADGEAESLLFFPDRFQQAMKLDERLLDLLTDANGVRITSEKVVAIVEQVFDALMSDTFVDEKQYVPDTGSFDLSKYLLDDGALICLFQMAKYLDMCACVSHLGLKCICHQEDFGLTELDGQMDGESVPGTDAGLEFVSWSQWDFPVSKSTVDGYVREAKERVFLVLSSLVTDQEGLRVTLERSFQPVVSFLNEYARVGWTHVPEKKLMAGMKLEEAYQELARVKAAALSLTDSLTVSGVMARATRELQYLFIADVTKKNVELAAGEEKFTCSESAFWEFIFTQDEGDALSAILLYEYVKGEYEGWHFTNEILRAGVSGEHLMEAGKPIGIVVSDKDFPQEHLNFLRALCKYGVIKLCVK